MSLDDMIKGESGADFCFHQTRRNGFKENRGVSSKCCRIGIMREYGWPGQEQAPFFIEPFRFDRRSGTRGGAKEDNKPEGCCAVERFEEGIM